MASRPPVQATPSSAERDRRAAESPPGSSARAESDVTGWSVERDEPPEWRQERLDRTALMSLASPRTAPPSSEDPGARAAGGPYGPDDRALDDAAGMGPGPLMGEQDWDRSEGPPRPAQQYRPWNRRR